VAGKRDWSIAFYGLIAAAVVGVAIFGMWAAGLLGGDNTGAGLAFGGTLLTGAVSFVGLVLNEREKDRLDVEAATEAATLLSTADAKPADRATTAGALLSLARLGQVHLASSMLFDLWGQDRISTADGVFIVNEALSSRNPQAQRDASTILFLKTPELTARGEKDEWYYWPYVIDHRWVARLPFEARYNLLQAWVYLWTESTVASTKYRLRNLTAGLLACWEKEPDKMLRTSISDMLRMVYGE
jgi:hypothetical protein